MQRFSLRIFRTNIATNRFLRSCGNNKFSTATFNGQNASYNHQLHSQPHLPPPLLNCELDTQSPVFKEAMERTRKQIEELNAKLDKVREGGGKEAVKRHESRGKFLARDRIQRLVDPGTPLLELSALAGCDAKSMDTEEPIPSGGIVTAIGVVSGRLSMLVANDATVKGGTYYPITYVSNCNIFPLFLLFSYSFFLGINPMVVSRSICEHKKSQWKTIFLAFIW